MLNLIISPSLVKVAASDKKISSERGHLTMNDTSNLTSNNNRRGSVDGVIQRCGLCSMLSSLLRRAMCVGSRRGSGESYYQELADTAVSLRNDVRVSCVYRFRYDILVQYT